MLFNYLNLSDEEHLRLNGGVPLDRLEWLIRMSHKAQEIENATDYITKALTRFPATHFLTTVIRKIDVVAANVSDENKNALRKIIQTLTDTELTQAHATKEAVDLLGKLTTIIEGAY
jgi:hypothetical protein